MTPPSPAEVTPPSPADVTPPSTAEVTPPSTDEVTPPLGPMDPVPEGVKREVWERDQLIALWRDQGETFKAEWAAELPEGEELTVYRAGRFLDMCRGPHLASTGKLDPQA